MQQPLIGLHFSPDLNLNLRPWGRSRRFCWQIELCTTRLSQYTHQNSGVALCQTKLESVKKHTLLAKNLIAHALFNIASVEAVR